MSGINGYNSAAYNAGNRDIITVNDDSGKTRTAGGSSLGLDDFLALLAAQLSNQDMMNPVSDTEFIAQMAQFSALEAMNTLTDYTLQSYAVSYAGKHVIISQTNEITNQLETIFGQVERVTFSTGEPLVVVDGVEYPLYTVMEISDKSIKPVDEDVLKVLEKYVKIEFEDEESGDFNVVYGQVKSVKNVEGVNYVYVNGKYYNYNDIVWISDDEFDPDAV